MAYSAGTAYLTVVPSFVNIQRAFEKEAKEFGKQLEDTIANSVPEGMRRALKTVNQELGKELGGVAKAARDEGDKAGQAFGGAFRDSVRRGLDQAFKTIRKVDVDADISPAETRLQELRTRLQELRDDAAKVDVELDADELFAELGRLRAVAADIEGNTIDVELRTNARAARAEIERVLDVGRAARQGNQFGGALGDAARRRIDAALKSLGDIDLNVHFSTASKHELRWINAELQDLRSLEIDVDIPADQYLRDLAVLESALENLERDEVNVRVKANVRGALAEIRALREFATGGGGKAASDGAQYGGAFAAAVRKASQAALDSWPEITLTADSSDADREIAGLRAQLAALSEQEIGVDIDAADALAQINAIEAQLRELGRSDPRIDVHTNLLATAAQLATLQQMIDRLDGQDIDVDVDVSGGISRLRDLAEQADFSMSRLGALIAVGASLGSAIVPAAAVAAVAISGIATAAAAATLGVGVLGLGLFGAVKAVGALDKYQKDANKSAVSLSGAQDRIANALASVRGAQRNLARAERDRLGALEDLSRAQEQARRQLEDMALAARSHALTERQARLDLAEAKRELDKVLANPRATEEEREQARITFEQRSLQMEELGLKGKRLAADKAEADRKGVEGSDQVKAAQDRIVAATESVAAAQESLAQSHRSLAAAYEKTGTAGGAALDNLKEAMDALSPAGQRFAKFIFGLKDEVKALQHAAEEGLLPGLEKGIRNLLPFLPQLESLIRSVGETMGGGFFDFTEQLSDPVWQKFFGYLADTAVPTLKGMFTFATHVSRGLAALLVALSPFNASMGSGLLDMAEGFARWAEQLDRSAGFQKFLDYVGRVGPKIVDLLGQVATFIGRIVIAAAPLGEFVIDVFRVLFTQINRIPIPVLIVLVSVIAALAGTLLLATAATRAWALITRFAAVAATLWSTVMTVINSVIGQYRAVIGAATTRTGAFSGALNTATASASAARVGMSGLIGVLGGPWGIAIAVATAALISFLAQQARIKESTDRMSGALGNIAGAFEEGGDAAVLALARQDRSVAEAIIELRRYGVTAKNVFDATEGDVEAQARVLDGLRAQLAEMTKELADFQKIQNQRPVWLQDKPPVDSEEIKALTALIKEQEEKYNLAARAAATYGRTTEQVADSSRRATFAADVYGQKITDLERLYSALTSKTVDASTAADAFRRYTDAATGAAVSANEAEEAHVRTLVELRQTLAENGSQLDLNTAATDTQRRSILANRDALQEALRASKEKTLADIAAKVGLDEANAANEERIATILAEIPANERNSEVVQGLVDRYGRIPAEVSTQIKTQGAEAVLQQLKDLKVAQYALEHNLTIAAARAALRGDLSEFESQVPAQARARGGYIDGPGGPTDDRIPAWLSNGEYVIPAWLVSKLGVGFFDQLLGTRQGISRGWALDPAKLGLAGGGLVAFPFLVDVSKTRMPWTLEDLRWRAGQPGAAGGFPPWPASPSASRGDSGVWRSIMGLVKDSGIPYTFGNSYRHGDPLWHGSGRAVDLMGYNQDALGTFFMDMRPRVLELIHTTNAGGYYVSRGQRRTSMGAQDALHRNHLHVAMDAGGLLQPGWNPPIFNGTGRPEPVLTGQQWDTMTALAQGGDGARANYTFHFRDTTLDASKLRALQAQEDARARIGRAR